MLVQEHKFIRSFYHNKITNLLNYNFLVLLLKIMDFFVLRHVFIKRTNIRCDCIDLYIGIVPEWSIHLYSNCCIHSCKPLNYT